MPKKITIIRHGQTEYNVRDIMQGQQHVPLDAVGLEQAAKVADRLIDEVFDVFYTSDLKRTVQTAEKIAQKIGKEMIHAPQLRERGLGRIENKTKDEAFSLLNIKHGMPPHHFWNFREALDHLKHGIEKYTDFNKRIRDFVKHIKREHKDEHVLLVSHGGTIRGILKHLGFGDEQYLKELPINNTAIVRLTKNGKGYDLEIDDKHVREI